MASVTDLHIDRHDQGWAKECHVLLHRTAVGSHSGAPYDGIEKSDPPKNARWSATAIFEIENGKIKSFTKHWSQKIMQVSDLIEDSKLRRWTRLMLGQIHFGWSPVTDSDDPRWTRDILANP